jgi:hypothetical protein
MADLPRELGGMNFGAGLANALAQIGKTLGESKRQEFVDKTLRDALRGINPEHPESAFNPEVMGKIASIQGYPEAEGSMGAIKMGDSLFGAMANAQTRKDAEKDRRYMTAIQQHRAMSEQYIKAQEMKDLPTQRKLYNSINDNIQEIKGVYPDRAVGLSVPEPVGYGAEYFAKLHEHTARAAKLSKDAELADIKTYTGMRKQMLDAEHNLDGEIAKSEDRLLKASSAKGKEALRQQYFPGSKDEELPAIISEAKQSIQDAKDKKAGLQNVYREQDRKYGNLKSNAKSETKKKFSLLNTEISQDDKKAVEWVNDPSNEGHKNYNAWVKDLKNRKIIQ